MSENSSLMDFSPLRDGLEVHLSIIFPFPVCLFQIDEIHRLEEDPCSYKFSSHKKQLQNIKNIEQSESSCFALAKIQIVLLQIFMLIFEKLPVSCYSRPRNANSRVWAMTSTCTAWVRFEKLGINRDVGPTKSPLWKNKYVYIYIYIKPPRSIETSNS